MFSQSAAKRQRLQTRKRIAFHAMSTGVSVIERDTAASPHTQAARRKFLETTFLSGVFGYFCR